MLDRGCGLRGRQNSFSDKPLKTPYYCTNLHNNKHYVILYSILLIKRIEMERLSRRSMRGWQQGELIFKVLVVRLKSLLASSAQKLKKIAGPATTGFSNFQTFCQRFFSPPIKRFLLLGGFVFCLAFFYALYLGWSPDLLSLLRLFAGSVGSRQLGHHLLPLTQMLIALGGLGATFFLVWAGIEYMTSAGQPQRLQRAKQIFKNALLGLLLILLATTLVGILKSSYQNNLDSDIALPSPPLEFSEVVGAEESSSAGLAVSDFLRQLLLSTLQPFLDLMSHLIQQTPLAGQNAVVVQLWWLVLGLVNALFVLIIVLLGFRLMSASALGFSELSFKQLIPKLIFYFVLINSSLFIIDVLISLSNALVQTLHNSLGLAQIWGYWQALGANLEQGSLLSLLLLTVFVVLSFCLLVYYILRWVVVYVGAVLSPLVILLCLLPSTRGFCAAAIKTYFYTIYILFIHALILGLGFGLLGSLPEGVAPNKGLLTLLIGIAVLMLMLKTPKTLSKYSRLSFGGSNLKTLAKDLGLVVQQGLEEMRGRYLGRQFKEDERSRPSRL